MKKDKQKNISMQDALRMAGMDSPYQIQSEKLIVDRAMDELDELVHPMAAQMIAARANAEEIRNYMDRYIDRIDCLLEVFDEIKWPEPKDEEDEE